MHAVKNLFVLGLIFSLLILGFACGDDDDDDDNDDDSVDDDDDTTDDDDSVDDDDDAVDDDDDDDDDTCVSDEFSNEFRTDPHGNVWSHLPTGCFRMGSPEGELGRRDNETQHEVTLTYEIEAMTTEITQELFEAFMYFNPSFFPKFGKTPKHPVESVTIFDAMAFANKLGAFVDREECYALSDIVCDDDAAGDDVDYCKDNGGIKAATVTFAGDNPTDCEGYRLPTEAEWEYLARAGSTTAFYNGGITYETCTPLDPNLAQIAHYCGNSARHTLQGGTKAPNAWGIYDSAGNVKEWTTDFYASNYGSTAGAAVTDPIGPDTGYFYSARGGAIRYDGPLRLRSAYRAAHDPSHRSQYLGIRLVRSLDGGGTPSKAAPVEKNSSPVIETKDLPDQLPWTYTRPDVGTPLTQQEISDFTSLVTGVWKDVDYFGWILWTSHGMADGNQWGMPDYKLYWQDTRAVKNGNVVTFEHHGGADNIMIRTPKIFSNAAAGYLASGNEQLKRVVIQYAKGYTALFMGLDWTDDDPEQFIMPRAIFTKNHSYTEDGREAFVDYDPAKHYKYDWNAHTIPNAENPHWGPIWLRNMRSQDDIPHIFRSVLMMRRVLEEATDPDVVEAVAEALRRVEGFAKDIVDSGDYVRTKDEWGNAYVPLDEDGFVADLASFTQYQWILPNSQCKNQLTTRLVSYQEPIDIECGNGIGLAYETVAKYGHYFNYDIIRYFHAAAAGNALITGQDDVALDLVKGLAERVDTFFDPNAIHPHFEDQSWDSDAASYLLAAASVGLPLTSQDARHVMEQYTISAENYAEWDKWDMWDASVPDGTHAFQPGRDGSYGRAVRVEELTFLMEYCYSPFKNSDGADLVDCDIVLDPSRWGE
jgi:formylglycine-generating enzyme required for sulfatase activity